MGITPGIPRPGGGGLGDIPANTALGNFTEASAVPTPQTKSVWLTWLNAATVDDLNSLGSVVSSIGSSLTALSETVATKVSEGDPRLTNARDWFASSVSQAEAEAGTEVIDRKWSALRVRQSTRVNPDWDPTGNLFTIGTSTNAQRLRLRRRFAGAGDFSQLSIDFSGDNCRIQTQHAGNNPNPLCLGTAGVDRLFLAADATRVGIGGAPTTRPLEIFAGTAGFRLQSSSAVSPPVYTEIARTFDFQTWQDSTSPFNTFTDLVANSNQFNNHSIRLFVHTSGTSAPVLHSVFHASGRLSVGTDVDNGTDRLQVNGNIAASGNINLNSGAVITSGASGVGTLTINNDGNSRWQFNGSELIATGGIRPDASGARNLGTSGQRWSNLWAGNVDLSGNITFTGFLRFPNGSAPTWIPNNNGWQFQLFGSSRTTLDGDGLHTSQLSLGTNPVSGLGDVRLQRNATGPAWIVAANGGAQFRNLANSADAPISCSNLTASETVTAAQSRFTSNSRSLVLSDNDGTISGVNQTNIAVIRSTEANANINVLHATATANTSRAAMTFSNSASAWHNNFIQLASHGSSYATSNYLGISNAGLALLVAQGVEVTRLAIGTHGPTPLNLFTNNVIRAEITAAGNLLLNSTTDNGARLQVNGNIATSGQIISTVGNNNSILEFSSRFGQAANGNGGRMIVNNFYNSIQDVPNGYLEINAGNGGVGVALTGRDWNHSFYTNGGFFCFGRDIFIQRDAANVWAQRNGTSAQIARWYKTFTSSTILENFEIDTATDAGSYRLASRVGSAGGSIREIHFGRYNAANAWLGFLSLNESSVNPLRRVNAVIDLGANSGEVGSVVFAHASAAGGSNGSAFRGRVANNNASLFIGFNSTNAEVFRVDGSGNTTTSGVVTSAFQSLSADPSTIDIPSGSNRIVKNTTSGEVRDWVNDGGIMKKSPAYT